MDEQQVKSKRTYRWAFTLNNWTVADVTHLHTTFRNVPTRYWVFGKEVGANGTPHLQGYVEWKVAKTLSATKTALGARCHVEPARTPKIANERYCKKEGDWEEKEIVREAPWVPVLEDFLNEIALDADDVALLAQRLRRFM